jgi:uncharacterized 2Fe-2S/4Fe-4S cluster protein (DUF4445 family)
MRSRNPAGPGGVGVITDSDDQRMFWGKTMQTCIETNETRQENAEDINATEPDVLAMHDAWAAFVAGLLLFMPCRVVKLFVAESQGFVGRRIEDHSESLDCFDYQL